MDLSTLKSKELQKEYRAFIDEDKAITYYTKKFQNMKEKGSKISFNIYGLLFGTFWCFYRKMLGWGCVGLVLTMGATYLQFAYNITIISGVVSLGLAILYGFFGNYLYMRYVERSIARGMDLEPEAKAKLYKDNGGSDMKILLCMLFVSFVMVFALAASFGIPSTAQPTV